MLDISFGFDNFPFFDNPVEGCLPSLFLNHEKENIA
jgi:hypothetical protein